MLQMDDAFYRRGSLQNVTVFYGPCCERKVPFYRGKLGATLIFKMLSEHILASMERAFYRGFIFLVFRRWQFEGCTWMHSDSCNCRV